MKGTLNSVNRNEVLKYLGYKGGATDEKTINDIQRISEDVIKTAQPAVTYMVFDIEDNFCFSGTNFIPGGNDIKKMLEGCKKAVLMAATLGMEIEKKLRAIQITDMYSALIFDCCASSAIENVCDNFQNELEEKVNKQGLFLTDRFSPGYGDMPLECQKTLCTVLDTQKKAGIALSRSGLMIPVKSVTAIMGFADTKQKKRGRGCEYCRMFKSCAFRKAGVTCEKN